MGTIQMIQMFALIGFVFGQKYDGYTPKCHGDVAKTIRSVEKCPTTAMENEVAVLRKACNQIPNECTSFVYHCLVNRFFNATYEFCSPIRQIVLKFCAEFNKGGGVIQGSRHEEGHCKSCPAFYLSNEAYKYGECYDRVMREVENIPQTQKENQKFTTVVINKAIFGNISTAGNTTTETALVAVDNEKTGENMWIIGLVTPLCAVGIVSIAIGYYFKQISERGEYEVIERGEANGIDGVVYSDTTNCSDDSKDTVICMSEKASEKNSSKNVITTESTQKESPMAVPKKNTAHDNKFEEKWVRQYERPTLRRCISESEKGKYIEISCLSNDMSLDEPQENTPLLGRENATTKDLRKSLDGFENQIRNEDFEASAFCDDKAHGRVRCVPPKCSNPVGSVDNRQGTKRFELIEASRNVRPRRRVKSESEAIDARKSDSSVWLSSIAED